MTRRNRTTLLGATGLALMLQALPVQAADDATLARIEKQISALQAELKHVKRSLATRDAEVRRAQAQAAQGQAVQGQAVPGQATAQGPVPFYAGKNRTGYASQSPLAPQVAPPGGPYEPRENGGTGVAALPTIPPGYALVPAQPGSAPGTVVLAQQETLPSGKPLPPGTFLLGPVEVSLGGFVDAASIYRTRNEVTDIAGNFNNGIPLPYQQTYHEGEFRETARLSRLTLLAQADVNPETHLAGYVETDFQGGSPTANSLETNSYTLRLRQANATLDENRWGLHVLAGQAFTLLTLNKHGIIPRQEDTPLGIDAQYDVGFNWARQVEFRIAKSFDAEKFWLAVSAEEPQVAYYTGPNGLAPASTGTVNITNPGVGALASTVNYSDDIAPDVIVKAALDPGWGHFEVEGLLRFLHDRVSHIGTGDSDTVLAGGGGAGAVLPLIPHKLDFRASGLAGDGIGRYGSAQLPDAVVGRDGAPDPLPEVEALIGLEYHVTPRVDLYAYGGTEQIGRRNFTVAGKGYGYGSLLYNNAGCETELSAAATCVANTRAVEEGTIGAFWRAIKGPYGSVQLGAQYEYLHRSIFEAKGPTPSTNNSVVLFDVRYFPFGD